MEAGFEYCGNSLAIKNFAYSSEDAKNGNPYNCSFNMSVVSGLWSGFADGCEYDYSRWKQFVRELEELVAFKRKVVEMCEIGYGGTLVFKTDDCGHMEISGKIYGSAMEYSLEFRFNADQTILPGFIAQLRNLVNE